MRETNSPQGRSVTLADIAEKAGVSVATVSLVLRNRSGVGDETRQRVYDAAVALGYIHAPSNQARDRRLPRDIGLVVKIRPDDMPTTNSFYAPVLAGIEAICRHNGIHLIYSHLPVDMANRPLEMPRAMIDSRVDGLLLVGIYLDHAMMETLRSLDIPIVFVDTYAEGEGFDAVVTDNFAGAYTATSTLIARGHQRIAIIGSQEDAYPSIRERRMGYLEAMAEHGLEPVFGDCCLHPDMVPPVVETLLEENPGITALFGCNDDVAIAAMRTAQEMEWLVPQDLSVIGFDNIDLAQHTTPALTTMRVDIMGMGRLAAQLLLNRFEHPETNRVRTVICPDLVERGSVIEAPPLSLIKHFSK